MTFKNSSKKSVEDKKCHFLLVESVPDYYLWAGFENNPHRIPINFIIYTYEEIIVFPDSRHHSDVALGPETSLHR